MKIISTEEISSTPWLRFIERRYLDRAGRESAWAYVERAGKRPAVLIIARTEKTGRIVLLRQYRLPFDCFVLEVPAGLPDEGETPEETARRELLEESGFDGRVISVSPVLCSSPGLTNETVRIVTMEVPEEPVRAPAPDFSEEIEVLVLSFDELGALINAPEPTLSGAPLIIDSRLYSWWRSQDVSVPGSDFFSFAFLDDVR
jgi:8-oxo-dGTP pyrophosphatase MutT (NUDIX family)